MPLPPPPPPPRTKHVSVVLTDEDYQILRKYAFNRHFRSFSAAIGALIREFAGKKEKKANR